MNNLDYKSKALYALKKYYGYDSFRAGQLNIILNILNKRDVFCIMSTGAGKSICYQVPALIFDGITIVISPLISLMKDQVDALKENGVSAESINSSMDSNKIKEIIKNAQDNKYKLLYIAPERLESRKFINNIKELNISQVAVDEAHCISQWGHDFRTSYKSISSFINILKNRPVVSAFTATATEAVKEDSINLLKLNKPYIYAGSIKRDNLIINVYKEEDKLDKIKEIIQNHKDESGIIYCLSRREAEELYKALNMYNYYDITLYHGGLKEQEKEKAQEDFLFERDYIMVATNAFGMGIDKSNVRFIIHSTIPKNLESYYQEIGRGGRDGENCDCYLFYNREDISRVEFIVNKSSNLNRRQIELNKLQSIIDFCEQGGCYQEFLLKYFNKNSTLMYCGKCSNCLKDGNLKDYTREAQIILSTVYRTREYYGISVIADIVRGINGPKIAQNNLSKVTTYGLMKDYSAKFVKNLIKELLNQNLVSLKEGTYSMLKLNSNSMKVLTENKHAILKIEEEEKPINKELFEALKKWRRKKALEENIKPYIIFSDSTLIELSNKRPKNLEELLEVRGIGEKKINKYGEEILRNLKLKM